MQPTTPTSVKFVPGVPTPNANSAKDCLMRTWRATGRTMSEVGSTVADLAKKTWSQIVTSSKQIGPQIVKAFTALKDNCLIPSFNAIKTFAKTNFEALKNFYTTHKDNINIAGAVALVAFAIGSACTYLLPKCCAKKEQTDEEKLNRLNQSKQKLTSKIDDLETKIHPLQAAYNGVFQNDGESAEDFKVRQDQAVSEYINNNVSKNPGESDKDYRARVDRDYNLTLLNAQLTSAKRRSGEIDAIISKLTLQTQLDTARAELATATADLATAREELATENFNLTESQNLNNTYCEIISCLFNTLATLANASIAQLKEIIDEHNRLITKINQIAKIRRTPREEAMLSAYTRVLNLANALHTNLLALESANSQVAKLHQELKDRASSQANTGGGGGGAGASDSSTETISKPVQQDGLGADGSSNDGTTDSKPDTKTNQ